MDPPITFKDGKQSIEKRRMQEREDSPGPSCVSMKSDHSMDPPITFKDGKLKSIEKRLRRTEPYRTLQWKRGIKQDGSPRGD
ncbi:unnamed protein product [Boreogadus saida]